VTKVKGNGKIHSQVKSINVNVQQKNQLPILVALCDTQSGNEVGLFYPSQAPHSVCSQDCSICYSVKVTYHWATWS